VPPRKAGAAVAALALLLASCVWRTGEPEMLSVAEALDLTAGGQAVLVDVRSADAYVRGHLPGAVNLPFPDVVGHAAELRRMRLPILYCG
jgi:rhodanese-related sulfurtransferase